MTGIINFKTHNKLNLELDVQDFLVPCSYMLNCNGKLRGLGFYKDICMFISVLRLQ
jgi:hypothetical protein